MPRDPRERLDDLGRAHLAQILDHAAREDDMSEARSRFPVLSATSPADCWWLRLSTVVRDLGIPAVIILWGMAIFSGWVPSALTALAAEMKSLTIEVRDHRMFSDRVTAELAATAVRQQRLLQVLCTAVVDKSLAPECLR